MRVNSSGTSAAHLGDGCRGYRPGAPCASIMGGMCGGGWGGVTAFRGFQRQQLSLKTEAETSGAAGWAVTVWSLTGAAEAQLEVGVAFPPPPRAETAVYFKLTVTPRSRLSINCEQFNHNVSSCLKLFERRKGQKRLRRVLIVIMFYALLHHLVNHLLTPHMCPVAKREVSRLGTTQLKS